MPSPKRNPWLQVADIALSAPLACIFAPHFNRLRHRLFVCQLLLYTLALCPVMWHMWIRAGNGNANSYFTATIIFNLAQVDLSVRLMASHLPLLCWSDMPLAGSR